MGSLSSRIIFSSVLDAGDRARVLAFPSFKALAKLEGKEHHIDLHLFRLGILALAGDKLKLTPAGRVVRRLLQEASDARA